MGGMEGQAQVSVLARTGVLGWEGQGRLRPYPNTTIPLTGGDITAGLGPSSHLTEKIRNPLFYLLNGVGIKAKAMRKALGKSK